MGHRMRAVLSQGRVLLWPPGHHVFSTTLWKQFWQGLAGVSLEGSTFIGLQYVWLPKQGRYTRMDSFGPEEHI